jgi:hypothetical protein
MKNSIDKYATKIVDNDYKNSKNKNPFTQAAGNLRDQLKYSYNSTTGKMDNADGGEASMMEAVKMNEALDKNFQDQKMDDYVKKLKHFGNIHSQEKVPGYPKEFNETPKQTWNRLHASEKERQQNYRRKKYYLKTWGIEDGPHNPDLKKIIRNSVYAADAEKKNNPTVNRYKEFKEQQKQKLEDKKFKENFEKEYGDKAMGQHIRAKVYKNRKLGKADYEGLPSSDIIVGEHFKEKAKKKLEAIKSSEILRKPETDAIAVIENIRNEAPAPMPTLQEWLNERAPTTKDPLGITGLDEVKKFRNNVSLTDLRFPKRAKGLGPLLGEDD